VRLGHLSEISALFTDREPPPGIRRVLVEHGVRLHIAEPGMQASDDGKRT
jgi:DeoR family glycerol-3-phosphate regulon repressor